MLEDGPLDVMRVADPRECLDSAASIRLDEILDIVWIAQPAQLRNVVACGVWDGLEL